MVDEIYVVREAMIWTIASTNVDLVTSAEDSDAFEAKAFELLSKTNIMGSTTGMDPAVGKILSRHCKRIEWGSHTFQTRRHIDF